MTSAELKLNIFRTIDKLKKSQLDELSGVISNYVQGQQGLDDWEKLSESEKKFYPNFCSKSDFYSSFVVCYHPYSPSVISLQIANST